MAPGMTRNRDSNGALEAPSGEQAKPGNTRPGPLGDPLVAVGFIALGLPLLLHLTGSQSGADGVPGAARAIDYVAICGGAGAELCGLLLGLKAMLGRGAASRTSGRIAVALLISALGTLHLLRGLGLIKLSLLG